MRFLGIAALVAAPMVFGVASPAGARSAAPRFVAAAHFRLTVAPSTNIKRRAAAARYKPARLAVLWSGPVGTSTCDSTTESFTITNASKVTQQPTQGGSAFGNPLLAGTGEIVCAFGSGTLTASFGLTGSTNILTVHIS
jgi:hypothetical protein